MAKNKAVAAGKNNKGAAKSAGPKSKAAKKSPFAVANTKGKKKPKEVKTQLKKVNQSSGMFCGEHCLNPELISSPDQGQRQAATRKVRCQAEDPPPRSGRQEGRRIAGSRQEEAGEDEEGRTRFAGCRQVHPKGSGQTEGLNGADVGRGFVMECSKKWISPVCRHSQEPISTNQL